MSKTVSPPMNAPLNAPLNGRMSRPAIGRPDAEEGGEGKEGEEGKARAALIIVSSYASPRVR